MTSEDDFQRALDANPGDWQTRLVLADFLEECGDPRAAGYRALAARRWQSYQPPNNDYWTVADYRADTPSDVSDLPDDWFALVWDATPNDIRTRASKGLWVALTTRRAAEDVAALAFFKLPVERQRELLTAEPSPPTPPKPNRAGRRKK